MSSNGPLNAGRFRFSADIVVEPVPKLVKPLDAPKAPAIETPHYARGPRKTSLRFQSLTHPDCIEPEPLPVICF